MRSVKAERMQRGARGKTPPRAVRTGGRKPAVAAATKRTIHREGAMSGVGRRMRGWLEVRRPMLVLSAALLVLVLVAALLVSGKVGRAVAGMNGSIDLAVAQAGFGISEIHLAGNVRTPPETILAALGFEPGQSIFAADLQSARARLMALDWVADADVQRRYPDAISVRLVEKLPFALWKSPRGIFVVERSGAVITDKDIAQFVRLPLLAGEGAPAAAADIVDAVAQHRAVAARIKAYQRQSDRRWDLILDDTVIVQLPETGWQKELDTLDHLIVDKGILERSIGEIDLRSPTHFFFILKSGQTKNVDRGSEL